MRRHLLLSLLLLLLVGAAAHEDHWKGADYAKNSASQRESAEEFMQGHAFKGTEAVLDVGCGDGKITAKMAHALPQGRVVGIDISPSMIRTALESFGKVGNLHFQVGNAAKLGFQNEFDLVTSFTVMMWVLEQEEALRGFAKALKPNGKLWIQMPTGLPAAMQEALGKVLARERWKSYFVGFQPPWRFYGPEEYRALLEKTHFIPTRITVIPKHERFPSRAQFQGFLGQWFPYLRPVPPDQKEAFLTELLDEYLKALPPDREGRVSFIVDRLEVEATCQKR